VGARRVRLDGEYDYFLATELAPEAVARGQLNMLAAVGAEGLLTAGLSPIHQ
jgi:hypothetical protein